MNPPPSLRNSVFYDSSRNTPYRKTAHPPLNMRTSRYPYTQLRLGLPAAHLKTPLNAARSPAWHGSRAQIAQGRILNTLCMGQSETRMTRGREITPAIADCRYREPLLPRPVRSCHMAYPNWLPIHY